jgi:hypothetical protein
VTDPSAQMRPVCEQRAQAVQIPQGVPALGILRVDEIDR